MARKSKLKIIQVASELAYGVDAIAAEEAIISIRGYDFSLSDPLGGDDLPLNYDDGELGSKGQIMAGKHVALSFKTYVHGAALATTPAAFAPLFKSCLRGQSIAAAVTHAIDQAATGSSTMYFWMDGTLHAVVGARGSLKFSATAKQLPYIEWTFTGLYVPPAAAAKPATDFSGWLKPAPVGVEHTSCLLDGTAVKLISLEYDQANQVEYQEYVGHQEIIISDCQPKAKMVFEAPALGTFNPFAQALAEGEHTFSITHGAAPNRFRWTTTRLQLGRPKYGDQQGTLTYELDSWPIGEGDQFITG